MPASLVGLNVQAPLPPIAPTPCTVRLTGPHLPSPPWRLGEESRRVPHELGGLAGCRRHRSVVVADGIRSPDKTIPRRRRARRLRPRSVIRQCHNVSGAWASSPVQVMRFHQDRGHAISTAHVRRRRRLILASGVGFLALRDHKEGIAFRDRHTARSCGRGFRSGSCGRCK